MPSNKELLASIKEASEKLGLSVKTADANNKALCDILSDLKAKQRDLDLNTEADKAESEKKAEEKIKERKAELLKVGAVLEGDHFVILDTKVFEKDLLEPTDEEWDDFIEALSKDVAEKEAEEKSEKEAEEKAEKEAANTPKELKYYVCKGKAITTKRGILADGEEIKPSDVTQGEKVLEKFVKTGHVEKK